MATKIRLQRHGKKRYAYYHIVIADARSKRDGKSIERIGEYNPNTNPATINLDFDRALYWLQTGAQPTDTMRAILSYKGVLYKHHLLNGVKKGAHSEEDVEKKFEAWLADKESRIQAKRDSIKKRIDSETASKMEAEAKIKDERARDIAAKTAPIPVEGESAAEGDAAAEGGEAQSAEATEAPAEAIAEVPVVEEAPAEKEEAAAEEATKAEEAPKAETEAPSEEAPKAQVEAANEAEASEEAKEEPSAEEEE